MLSRARRRPDVEWVRGDAPSASWDREFDLAVTAVRLDAGQRLEVVDAAGVTVRVHDEVEAPVSGDVVRVGETMTSPVWDGPHTEWANLRFLDVRRTG